MLHMCGCVLASVAPLSGQSDDVRTATFTVGAGNSTGWFGMRGEGYLLGDRVTVFGGMGVTPAIDGYRGAGLTMAVGGRGYTPGRHHRAFLEFSLSQVQIETRYTPGGIPEWHGRYGPGLQLGYQFVTGGGFTLDVSGGAGYSLGGRVSGGRMAPLLGLGLGYTFR
jgi:hypothetical protein